MRFWSPGCGLVKISNGTLFESLRLTPHREAKMQGFPQEKHRYYGAQAVGWENFKSAVGKPRVDPPMGAKM